MLVACCGGEPDARAFEVVTIEIAGNRLDVWLADESSERRQGLSEIERLPSRIDGMLFVFPVITSPSFNMRDVHFPLDIWWFDSETILIGKTAMEPCAGSACTSYGSPGEVGWALETPVGEHDFEPGARLSIVEND